MAAQIFISFSSHDRHVAETICTALEKRGLECWISSRDVPPGGNFQSEIVHAIRNAKAMLLVFTARANNSDEIKKELVLAGQRKLVVVPLRVEDVTPNDAFSYELATRQWIDMFDGWEQALDRLVLQLNTVGIIPAKGNETVRASATDDRSGPEPSHRRWIAKRWFSTRKRRVLATAAAAAAVVSLCLAIYVTQINGSAGCRYSTWANAGIYQQKFSEMLSQRKFPEKLEGRFSGGQREFRGCFRAFPERADFQFESRHGIDNNTFKETSQRLKLRGYTLRYMQAFDDGNGPAIQATWTLHD